MIGYTHNRLEIFMHSLAIVKKILMNGLTVLVCPRHDIPKVSVQLWYHVGAKNEQGQQRGIAHFIEHMIFKGTDTLSESDINVISYKLSGMSNAFTSHDYTGYLFDMPSQHWQQILPVMADCMTNCTFKQEHLNSELKAVIQEMRMYNDDYFSTLVEKMMGSVFSDHPYHYPIIGYKKDLWSLDRSDLIDFYQQYYVPDNAVLVIVGDVEPEEAFAYTERAFGAIPASGKTFQHQWDHATDLVTNEVVVRRDVQQPILSLAWTVPGVREKKEYELDLLSWVLFSGRGSRLYTKLVMELNLATEVQGFVYDLFDTSVLFLYIQPNSMDDATKIKDIVSQEIKHYQEHDITDAELARAKRKTHMDFLSLYENNQKLAYLIGKLFTATSDEKYLQHYISDQSDAVLKATVRDIFAHYLLPSFMQTGAVLPLNDTEKELWQKQQELSDAEDARVLGDIVVDKDIEEPQQAAQVTCEEQRHFAYPKPYRHTLSNGLKLFLHAQPGSEKIDLLLDLKAKHYFDAPDEQGLGMMVADLMQEGTRAHDASALAQLLEGYGMELNTFPGQMSIRMLAGDAKVGVELLREILTESTMSDDSIEQIRQQMLAELRMFWDSPAEFVGQLGRQLVYKDHPYGCNAMGTIESVSKLTRQQVLAAYKKYIVPNGARMAVVGDFDVQQMIALLESILGNWRGEDIPDVIYPPLAAATAEVSDMPMNRDQVVLAYAGLSVARFDKDFDALLLFDQIFTGGVLGSMNSRLFAIRERTGLFYTIGGSLLAGVGHEPGMVFIKTIVSGDRLAEAEKILEQVITEGAQVLCDEELEDARRALSNAMVDNFSSGAQTAATFVTMDRYGLPDDYFDTRTKVLAAISKETIVQAVARVLAVNKLIKIRVGRLNA